MTVIACLGWGSLIWDPRELPIRRRWFEDGPLIRVEFSRKSRDGRVTLALTDGARPVRALWAIMDMDDPDAARDALGARERIPSDLRSEHVGVWSANHRAPGLILGLEGWAQARTIDHVLWTALPTGLERDGRIPGPDEVIDYLRGLRGTQRAAAEQYVRFAPRQTDTDYRRAIEAKLGWVAQEPGN